MSTLVVDAAKVVGSVPDGRWKARLALFNAGTLAPRQLHPAG